MTKRKNHNPEQFTTDEAQTATLIYTEGTMSCHKSTVKGHTYFYPRIDIKMCIREGLKPAARVFRTAISPSREKAVVCPPELFPPDGKGIWRVSAVGKTAEKAMERLHPLIPTHTLKKWQELLEKCR